MKLPRIVYTRPQSNGALFRKAVSYGLACAVLCGLIWLSLKTGSFPSRRGLTAGVGSDSPFFYMTALVYGLMALLTGWIASHAVVTLINRTRHERADEMKGDQ